MEKNVYDPKLLLNDTHVSSDAGNSLWYGEPYFQSGSVKGTFRHVHCKRIVNKEHTSNGMCSACQGIPKINTFRMKLLRRNEQTKANSPDKINFAYLSKEDTIGKLRDARDQIERYKSKLFLLSSELARVKTRAKSLKDEIKEFSKRGDIKAISYNIAKAYDEGKLKDKTGLIDILGTISNNLRRKKKGKSQTANRFTHNEVLHQWLVLGDLCKAILEPALGPGIGHASDGDSRRRKLMLNQAMSPAAGRYRPVPVDLGFIMSATIEVSEGGKRVLRDIYDQDSIHNDKKIINPLDHTTRVLRLGRYSAHMNHLRLVMALFPPCVHGMHADDVARKDRQKWEVVQRLKFKSVQQCLLDISNGNNDTPKDATVYGTWAFLYVAWHYTEIFFSLHASLRDRVKYCAFVSVFFGLWRNWVIISDDLTLKANFLTRECFQDVLLSCHYVVILISFFRDEYPHLECPLDLTGTDCCERYFSENGSFVKNRHNYTFLDMHTGLGYMNRLQEIKATNPDIKFPTRKHNNDFIWDRQFEENERKPTRNLKDYPSADQVICAWKEGVEMAKQLARKLGMNPETENDEDSEDSEWFQKPMSHVDFQESLKGMLTDEEEESLRMQVSEQEDQDYVSSEESTQPASDISEDIRHIVNPLLDQEGVGKRYKSTVVSELRNNPQLSTDRLKRVRSAAAAAAQDQPNDDDQTTGHSLCLFDDCALYDPDVSGRRFVLGRVQRMRKKGKSRGYVEYVRPVDLANKPSDVELFVSKYLPVPDADNMYSHSDSITEMSLQSVICKVRMNLEDTEQDNMYKLCPSDGRIVNEFITSLQVQQSTRRQQRTNNRAKSSGSAEIMADEGRRVDTVTTSRGRQSRQVSYLF
ncbi:hypothetical protein OS493_004388 [Desmophyllum pertusum]|uniref:Uncharacterized protein n=1 Tax=Desmophyllum pertusum TaxID=174260 RepID=A0A9W9ZUH4_9CNID|nr:hypothetical protein OS493_004388 [Desmophyllum pertusum]